MVGLSARSRWEGEYPPTQLNPNDPVLDLLNRLVEQRDLKEVEEGILQFMAKIRDWRTKHDL